MLPWIKITIQAEIELVESLYSILYRFGFLHITVNRVFTRKEHSWFEMLTYFPDDSETEERKEKLVQALWHLQAFDLCDMDPPEYDRVLSSDLLPGDHQGGVYWITEDIGIHLGYEQFPNQDSRKIVVTLKPGTAFGTGFHPSTRLAVRALEKHLKPHMSMLDVGTGTGILSLIAAQMGCPDITAVDINKPSVESARENAILNTCKNIQIAHASIGDVSTSYDLVVANMPASILSQQRQFIVRAVRSEGILILSGMISHQAGAVEKQFEAHSLEKIAEIRDNDWIAYIYRRPKKRNTGELGE